jgi:glutaredoxin-like protein
MVQQSMIPDQDKSQLKRTFRKDLKSGIAVTLFTHKTSSLLTVPGRDCRYCPQTEQLMAELASLSPKIELETVDFYQDPETAQDYAVSRIPAIVLAALDAGSARSRVKFYGIPSGYLTSALVEDIKTISRRVSPLSTESRKQLRRVNRSVHIQVFVTPTDPTCPELARLAHAMALENSNIKSDVVEIQEFPAMAQTYGVRSVPFTVINEQYRFAGPATEPQLLEKVVQAGVEPETVA